jgi:hypothetical protein
VAAVAASALAGVPQPAFAQESESPGDTLSTALTVKTDQVYRATREAEGVVDVYRLDVAAGVQAIRVGVAQTNRRCEVWASLLNGEGTEVNRAYAPRSGVSVTQTSAGVSTYFS